MPGFARGTLGVLDLGELLPLLDLGVDSREEFCPANEFGNDVSHKSLLGPYS